MEGGSHGPLNTLQDLGGTYDKEGRAADWQIPMDAPFSKPASTDDEFKKHNEAAITWAEGIAKWLNIPDETPLSTIDREKLIRAIARQEGWFAGASERVYEHSGLN